ncbi:exodeoxyribonuclease VII small subunit [Alphaproteobacteria bacterium]|jgi:exodeoxyribonuclease VII small subunit|nr:exodeoxyribonuclease VII small subunit [Alphaproteobacteria bacterium]MDC0624413.1 exodeoxyribonuclease VII small subunit [Alphaproteobacteria bacterium]|tara:strand:- start:451 stop:672 length:222 start_codon:yes stop_codon:yes gene_type:complete
MSKEKDNNFETNLKKLEMIVDKLESGDIGLEESVKLYEEGMKIKKICDKKLKDIEMQIKKIKIEDNKVVKEDL